MSIPSEFSILQEAIDRLQQQFQHSFTTETDLEEVAVILNEVADRMENNYPYFDNNYAGQMLKPPHPIARLTYMLAMYFNPNNHALDGGRASSQMEKEAVAKIAQMFGWTIHLGHLTGGGTMANMEALWVARKERPNELIVASEMAHYTHSRISEVLGLEFKSVPCDTLGRMDMASLEETLQTNKVGTVVVTLGTTGAGAIDPLTKILQLQKSYSFRIHVDSAYGGYFILADNLSNYAKEQYDAIKFADSVVIDPHKHGLQPYGCGCIVFKDPKMGRHYQHDSPYTYFSSAELHLGEISLECSRAGAAAVALWATMQMFPLEKKGSFSDGLESCINAAQKLKSFIENDPGFILLQNPELDIVVWGVKKPSLSEISEASQHLFDAASKRGVHLALFKYPSKLLPESWGEIEKDQDHVTCLRSCLMKFEHNNWVERIWSEISSCLS